MNRACIIFLVVLVSCTIALAGSSMNSSLKSLTQRLQTLETDQQSPSKDLQINIVNGNVPYSIIYGPDNLFQWQLYNNCYFDYQLDTTATSNILQIDYIPNDTYFPNLPAFFHFTSEKPSVSLDGFKEMMLEKFQEMGDSFNYEVLIDESADMFGTQGHHYVQSFFSNGVELVIDCYFVLSENSACAVYYITESYYYGNFIYQLGFESTLSALEFSNATRVDKPNTSLPVTFNLNQNYPNPFNNKTRIQYQVNSNETVKLQVFDSNGRLVKTLVNAQHTPGQYEADFNAQNLASGVYVYKLTTGNHYTTHKMTLVK